MNAIPQKPTLRGHLVQTAHAKFWPLQHIAAPLASRGRVGALPDERLAADAMAAKSPNFRFNPKTP